VTKTQNNPSKTGRCTPGWTIAVLSALVLRSITAAPSASCAAQDAEPTVETDTSPDPAEPTDQKRRRYRLAPDDSVAQIRQLKEDADGLIGFSPLVPVKAAWQRMNDDLEESVGLRLGIAYTALYQQASASLGPDHAGGGFFELFGVWHIVGEEGDTSGGIVFTLESAHAYTTIAPKELGASIGSLWGTVNEFGDQGIAFTDMYWQQQFAHDRFGFRIGKIDMSDVFNTGRFASDKQFFLNEAFGGNPALPFPQQGLGLAFSAEATETLRFSFGAANATGDRNGPGFDQLGDNEVFSILEVGFDPHIKGHGVGNYDLSLWHADAQDDAGLPSGNGVALSADQEFNDSFAVFIRAGVNSGGVKDTRGYAGAGAVLLEPFDRRNDSFGVGLSWGQPDNRALRDQYAGEVYYRVQLTPTTQITPSVQLFIDPALNPDEDAIAVLSLRARVAF